MSATSVEWLPSKEEWKAMQDSVHRMEVALIGELGNPNNEKCMTHLLARLATTVYGPEGQPQRGLDYRTERTEKEQASEKAWRKGAVFVICGIGSCLGVMVGWLLSYLKKP